MSSAKSARYNRFSGGPANLPSPDSSGVREVPEGLPSAYHTPGPQHAIYVYNLPLRAELLAVLFLIGGPLRIACAR